MNRYSDSMKKLKFLNYDKIEPRLYQEFIATTAIDKNTLCILPTGMGKTLVAVMVAAFRLENFPKSKILMVAPTRPLVNQHMKTFKKLMDLEESEFVALTGKIHPSDREVFYSRGRLFFATPQLIRNDIKNKILSLNDYSLVVVDECVSGDAKVKLWDGHEKEIEKIVDDFNNGEDTWVLTYNEKSKLIEPRKVVKVFKIPCMKKIVKITYNGKKTLIATADHLILALKNSQTKWVEAKKLKHGDLISLGFYDEEGIKNKDLKIISENDIINTYKERHQDSVKIYNKCTELKKQFRIGSLRISKILNLPKSRVRNYIDAPHQKPVPLHTIENLKRNGLFPLTYSNPRLVFLARIFGHIFGDGHLHMVNGEPKVLGFSGKKDDLQLIQKDLDYLNITHSSIHSRMTSSEIRNGRGRKLKIRGLSNSFTSTNSGLVRLFFVLGAPTGKKADTNFEVPKWLLEAPRIIKSEFLSSLMGSDGYVPGVVKNSRYFYVSRFTFYKRDTLKKNGIKYANQLIKLFKDCGVRTNLKIKRGNTRKNGIKTLRFEITILNSTENLLNFFINVGFKYSKEKYEKGLLILKYLNEKFERLKERRRSCLLANHLYRKNWSVKKISKKLNVPVTTIWSWVSGKRKPKHTSPFFPTFEDWNKKNVKKKAFPFKWIKIEGVKPTNHADYVYDLTVEQNHNFFANNLIVHNCHRSVKKYAYTSVIDYYIKQASNPLILGLTASPGGIKDKINEVKENLHIQAVEIRTEKDGDVKPYVQEIKVDRVYVELPKELLDIRKNLKTAYEKRLDWLIYSKLIYSKKVGKKVLLDLQKRVGAMYQKKRDYMVAKALTTCAQAIKIEHALGLLESQGITSLYRYLLDLHKNKSTANRTILKDPHVIDAINKTKDLYVKGLEHPKLGKLVEIVEGEIKKKPNTKVIVFANYRVSVEQITKLLKAKGIEAREFIGQAVKKGKGLKQKEQMEILNEFGYELFNVLVATSVGEEGLDIEEVDLVIFYEPVPSEIRSIQRRGRTGRTRHGRVVFLITKDTRDEGYYWSAFHKEKKMKKILYKMKEKNLKDWTK